MKKNLSWFGIGLSLTLMLASTFPAFPASLSIPSELAQQQTWLNLLHYGDGWLITRARSRVDLATFFIAADGVSNPAAELSATVAALEKPEILVGREKIAAACAFPARKLFLEKALGTKFPDPPCPKLDAFMKDLIGERVSLVFSTAFPNNPGSMFGHTFFKFSAWNRPDLLQPSISYAAYVGQDGGLAYMARGLFGGYPGAFALTPYYAKVNEYVRSESRDLWEYELNLTPAQIRTLAFHIWELERNGGFDYYFFDENCAYLLMRVLEVANPEWDLRGNRLFTVPGTTVRQLVDLPGAVKSVKFRPSLRRQLVELYRRLDDYQLQELKSMLAGNRQPAEVGDAQVLDVALSEIQYQKSTGSALDQAIRQARSKLKAPGIAVNFDEIQAKNRPELGHAPTQLSLGGGVLEGAAFTSLGFKFAFHDLLNSDLGYEPFSHIDFPSIRVRLAEHHGLYVERVGFVAITSLFPWTAREKSKSWKLALDVRPVRDLGCSTCHVAHGDFGFGVAVRPWTERIVSSAFLSLYGEGGSILDTARVGPKAEWLTVGSLCDGYKILFDASWSMDAFQSNRNIGFWTLDLGQSFRLARDLDFRMNVSRVSADLWNSSASQEAQASLQFYW